MANISTQDYLNKNLDTTKKHLVVHNTQNQQVLAAEQNLELLTTELQQKKQALLNQKLRTVSLILSILLQVVEITPVALSNIKLTRKAETPPIEFCDGKIKKN